MVDQATREVNEISTAFQHASNLRTREQWLDAVLHSGRVSRIGQHLALVIYHLSDTTTNIAKLSARDLERITGWGRTAIIEHLNELHRLGEFLRVQWGQGRAKSIFELQGVIAEVMAAKKAERQADTEADAKTDTTPSVREPVAIADATPDAKAVTNVVASQADAKAATNDCDRVADTSFVRQPDTTLEKTSEGGTIGGECNSNKDPFSSPPARERAAPDWMISEDGGFEGQTFEILGIDYEGIQRAYANLEFPAEMILADKFFAVEFLKQPPATGQERMLRLHQYLNKQNRQAGVLRVTADRTAASKPRKAAAPMIGENADHSACWVDETGLHLVNGYRAEWLEKFDNSEARLDMAIKEIAPHVKANSQTPLMVQVNGKLAKIVGEKIDKDTRYAKATKPERGISRLKQKFLTAGE